ncbi:protein kinase domain-containing protein [Ramlibacter sp. MMS24-I3-19]|uniref:serine/threonine-protein kinase n=1 Tax=Ramlibacter sp. MMS24-I3-19 TaxID=3416606 RepID=UPI003D02CE49
MHQRKLGRYELVRVLGKGAMGVVYEARDPNLDRRVAIKTIMVDDLAPGAAAEYEERFRTEARSAARLQHPNIVTVHDSDRDGNTAFLVMEFVEGDDLKRHLDRGDRHDVQQALRLITDLLAALDFAHRQGVVHRDVKPANLLIEPGGRLKLTDFGVARIAGEATRTQGSMIGTLKYMAPEQVQGQKIDARADLFSAAVVAYQLVTGLRPFDGDNDFSIIQQVIGHTPPAPSVLKPGLPAAVDAVFARALAKNRNDRYQTGGEFSEALQAALDGVVLPVGGTTVPGMHSMRRSDTMPLPGAVGIGQELELEYWRAVRDTTDLRELEGFLIRFPSGIYADLARRRLQRLIDETDPDRTMLQGRTRPLAASPVIDDPDATRTEPVHVAVSSPAPLEPTARPATTADAIPVRRVRHEPDDDEGARPARRKGRTPWALGGVAVAVVVVAVAAIWGAMRSNGGPVVGTTPPAAKLADRQSPQTPSPATVTTADRAAPVSTGPASQEGGGVGTARTGEARTGKAASASRSANAAARNRPASPAAPAGHSAVVAQASDGGEEHAVGGLVPPAVTCKDKMFLAKQYCVYSECQKPGYANFPTCVRLREDAKLRDAGKYGN